MQRSSLAAVLATTFGVGLLFGFQPPLIALALARSGASSLQIGAVTSASTVAIVLVGPSYPRLIGRLGLRLSILGGIVLAVAVLAAMPAFPGVAPWLALRLATGYALGLTWIASEIWLNRLASDQSRGTLMALYATIFAAGVVAGPVLLEFTGTAGSRPFWIGGIGLLLTSLPLLFVRDLPAAAHDLEPMRRPMQIVLAAPAVMLAALVAGLVESADISLLPLVGLHYGLGERLSLLLVTVFLTGNVVLQLPIGRLADRYGRRRTLMACAAISVAGPLLLPATAATPDLMWLLLFVWGGTMYGFYTQGIALLGDSFGAGQLPAANTVFVMVYCAGGVVGPSVGGLAMDRWQVGGFVAFVSAAALLLVAGLLLDARRPRRAVTAGR